MARSSKALIDIAKMVKAAAKDKPIEEEFLYELELTIGRMDWEDSRVPSKSYKPSSLGGCLRKIYFEVTGVEIDKEYRKAENIGVTEHGTDRHERIQKAVAQMKEYGYDCEWINIEKYIEQRKPKGTRVVSKQGMETKCFNDVLNISFLCDGVIKYKNRYYILEIKTEGNVKWQKHIEVQPNHLGQICSYSVCLGIDEIIMIYENRDYLRKKVCLVAITDEMKQEHVLEPIEEVEGYREMEVVPPKSDNSKDCTYCKYKSECRKW